MLDLQETRGEKSPMPCEERCPYCTSVLQVIWVHGHGQCASCGINVEPCCSGAPANNQ